MKMKKIVSLMLALVMMMPVFTGGSINAFATDETSSNTVVETSEPSNPMTVLKNILSDLLRGFDYTSSSGISEDTAQNSTTAMLNLLPEGTTMESAVVTSEAFGKNAVFKNTSVNLYQTLTYNAHGVHITVEPGTEIILGDTYTFKTDAGTFVFYQYSASGIQVTSDDLENYWRDFCYVYSEDVSILSDPVQTEKTDEATAITVSAVIPPEATMTVTPISLADSGLNTDEISVYGTPLFYRVTFMYLGKEYLPENGITVVIPETAIDTIDLKPGDYYKVYEIADDSTEVSEPLVYTGGCITKEFSGLSVFGIAKSFDVKLTDIYGDFLYEESYFGYAVINTDTIRVYGAADTNTTNFIELTGVKGVAIQLIAPKVTYENGVVYHYAYDGTNTQLDILGDYFIPEEYITLTCCENCTGVIGCLCNCADCSFKNICAICGASNCKYEHLYCHEHKKFDCTEEHSTVNPEPPLTYPEIPGNVVIPEGKDTLIADANGDSLTSVRLLEGTKTSLSAWSILGEEGTEYQWQICIDVNSDIWTAISGQTGKGILLSPATVNSIIALNGYAKIRCRITSGGTIYYTDAITVTVGSAEQTEIEKTDTATGVAISAQLPEDVELTVSPKTLAESGLDTAAYPIDGASLFYDVTLLQNGAEYQPENGITVTFPESAIADSGLEVGDYYRVYHIHDGVVDVGSAQKYDGGDVSVDFANLSVMGIAESDAPIDLISLHGGEPTIQSEYIDFTIISDKVTLYDSFENSVYTNLVEGVSGIQVSSILTITFPDGYVLYQYEYLGDNSEFKEISQTYQFISAADVTDGEVTYTPCAICGEINCTTPHLYCHECSKFDCGLTHEKEPAPAPITSPVIPNPEDVEIPEDKSTVIVDAEGNAVTSENGIQLAEGTKTSFSAWSTLGEEGTSYQWQICYDTKNDLWIDISGQTGKGILLSPAMVNSVIAMNGENTKIRCRISAGETAIYYSEAIPVSVAAEAVEPASAMRFNLARSNASGVMLAAEEPDTGTYTVTINYMLDGERIRQMVESGLGANTNFKATIPTPQIVGYSPIISDNGGNSTEISFDENGNTIINIENIQEHKEYTISYEPAEVTYYVEHYKQNITDDKYVLEETVEKKGITGTIVPEEVAKIYKDENNEWFYDDDSYRGFYPLLFVKPEIAASGDTVVKIYYDRNYYLINFDMDGGYGTTPVYDRFGARFTVEEPKKAGYTFIGWSLNGTPIDKLPETIPAENRTYKAIWKAADSAKLTIVIWGENASDNEYSYIETIETNVATGTELNFDSLYLDCGTESHQHSEVCYACNKIEHIHDDSCYVCGNEEHMHLPTCVSVIGGTLSNSAETNQQWLNQLNNAQPSQKGVYTVRSYRTRYYVKIGNYFYQIDNYNRNNFNLTYTCGKTEHAHNTDCGLSCTMEVHNHSAACGYDCGKNEHIHTNSCYSKESPLETDLWTYVRSDKVTVEPDGSTVMKVYYDRVRFTLTFKDDNTVYTLTEKWGANITGHWPIKGTNGTTYNNGERWDPSGSKLYSEVLVYLEIMPAESFTLNVSRVDYDTFIMHYMVETLEGQTGTSSYTYNGTTKQFIESSKVEANYNFVTKDEDFFDLEGFEQWTSDPVFGSNGQLDISGGGDVYFYYTRNKYAIEFYNPTEKIKTETGVPYEASLGAYNWTPDPSQAPDKYERGSVVFDGWYLDPNCSGEEYILSEHTMPVGTENGAVALSLYAKWKPVEHTVSFYLDKEAHDNGTKLSTHPDVTVDHGEKVLPVPAEPEKGAYKFVGWFYIDENGEEQAFKFEDMPVTHDMEVYGKWTSDVIVEYTVYYRLQGTDVQVAEPYTSSALAGTNITANAKVGNELYEEYRNGHFPLDVSRSFTVEIEGNNEFYIDYISATKVPYSVYYVTEKQNEEESLDDIVLDDKTYYILAETFTNENNTLAVVTENYKKISGYIPDTTQKRLVLDANGSTDKENKIVFVYTTDDSHALYTKTHYVRDLDGVNWVVYQTEEIQGTINASYSINPITIEGFTHDPTAAGTVSSGTLTAEGLHLKLYYERNSYPYVVNYLEKYHNTVLLSQKTGTALFGQTIDEKAIAIDGYTADEPTEQSIEIKTSGNVITFYYVKDAVIKYVVVGPTGCGSVNPSSETVSFLDEIAQGSTATPSSANYNFVGWYSDAACVNSVGTNNTYVPTKPTSGWTDVTYYAKFELAVADLTITKKVNGGLNTADVNQSFMFNVTGGPNNINMTVVINGVGSITIKDLLIGTYTVTELTDWSWRYTPISPQGGSKSITLNAKDNEVKFENERKTPGLWLDGDSYCRNWWGGANGAIVKSNSKAAVIKD